MKKTYKILTSIIVMMIALNITALAGDYKPGITLEYDGFQYPYETRLVDVAIDGRIVETGDMSAVIVDSRTLVPVREVFESDAIGAKVIWDGERRQVHIYYKDQYILLTINSTVAYVNGQETFLDVPAKLIRDTSKSYAKTMIPLRFVAEQLGYSVQWNGDDFVANLYSDEYLASLAKASKASDDKDLVGSNNGFFAVKQVADLASVAGLSEAQWISGDGEYPNIYRGGFTSTSLSEKPVSLLANPDELAALEQVSVDTDVTGVANDYAEIYNISYTYDEGSPEKVRLEISSGEPFSDILYDVENGVFELYVLKCKLDMTKRDYEYDDHPYIDSLSIKEYTGETTGNQNCLLKFNLNRQGLKFKVSMNDRREKIYVDVVMEHVSGVTVGQDDSGDYVELAGVETDKVKVQRLDAKTLSFDFDRVNTLLARDLVGIDGAFIDSLSITQKDVLTANIKVGLKKDVTYSIEKKKGATRIIFRAPTYDHMDLTTGNKSLIRLIGLAKYVDMSDIKSVDDYQNKQYIMTLAGNYLDYFGQSLVEVNNQGIDDINLALDGEGNTLLTITNNSIQAMTIEKVGDDYLLEAKEPGQVYSRIITIDPGHGGYKPGAYYYNTYEKNINLQVVLGVKALLDKDPSIKAYYVRLEDKHVELADRMDLAQEVQSDLFLSIHANSYYSLKTGAVTLYMDQDNGTSLTNYGFGRIIQDNYTSNTQFVDKVITERDDLYVLKYAKMPAALLELGYMSNPADLKLLKDEEHQKLMAEGIYKGIVKGFEALGL